MIRVEAGSSIPHLVCNLINSILCISSIDRAGRNSTDGDFLHRDKCALFCYFAILIRWVSLKEIEFTYSKFQQIINSTTHQILSEGGSLSP
jgi:hypothetical protein